MQVFTGAGDYTSVSFGLNDMVGFFVTERQDRVLNDKIVFFVNQNDIIEIFAPTRAIFTVRCGPSPGADVAFAEWPKAWLSQGASLLTTESRVMVKPPRHVATVRRHCGVQIRTRSPWSERGDQRASSAAGRWVEEPCGRAGTRY